MPDNLDDFENDFPPRRIGVRFTNKFTKQGRAKGQHKLRMVRAAKKAEPKTCTTTESAKRSGVLSGTSS
jgi:hypothetical protein